MTGWARLGAALRGAVASVLSLLFAVAGVYGVVAAEYLVYGIAAVGFACTAWSSWALLLMSFQSSPSPALTAHSRIAGAAARALCLVILLGGIGIGIIAGIIQQDWGVFGLCVWSAATSFLAHFAVMRKRRSMLGPMMAAANAMQRTRRTFPTDVGRNNGPPRSSGD